MRAVSVGGGLVVRQILFLLLLVCLSGTAIIVLSHVRDGLSLLGQMPPEAVKPAAADLKRMVGRGIDLLYGGGVLGCILALGVSAPLIHRTISRPIHRLAEQIRALEEGGLQGSIEGFGRTDEIGDIARRLSRLRDAVHRSNETMAALQAAREERDAWLERKRTRRSTAEQFGARLGAKTAELNAMTERLRKASESMIGHARRARSDSELARVASDAVSNELSIAVTTAEGLSDSIRTIHAQVERSTDAVKAAVDQARSSADDMGRLSTAASRIGDVVELISNIASQTNLLALNATIEASRAGELGRGFGIVAQEVKLLATQTARATQEISIQISEIQSATNQSVGAIDSVCGKILEVDRISSAIVATMRGQSGATRRISTALGSSVEQASDMASHLGMVEQVLAATSSAADGLQQLAHDLDDMASGMRQETLDFAKTLKASVSAEFKDEGVRDMLRGLPRSDVDGVAPQNETAPEPAA